MKTIHYLVLIGLSGAIISGCASRRPETSSLPPQQIEDEYPAEEEMDVLFIETDQEKIADEIAPEEVPPRQNLSWEEIVALGETYRVQKGDTLGAIGSRYDIGTGLLARINNLSNPDLIRVGQNLKVIRGPFRVTVDKSDKTLDLYLSDKFIRSYPVTVGRNNSTPEGEFTVLRKMKNPPWTDPYNRTILTSDHPEYPLGTRWIEFKAPPGAYGIHGSKEAEQIGQEASFGCVRVLHPQEEELYDFLVIKSPILIQE